MKTLHTTDPGFAEAWAKLCARGSEEDEGPVREAAARVVAEVRARGDAALLELTGRFDGWKAGSAEALAFGPAEFKAAFKQLPPKARQALQLAADRITAFHEREIDAEVKPYRDRTGAGLGQVTRPLGRVGVYAPGGTARYPSTILMTAVPARVAGVGEVVACSPGVRGTGEVDLWTLAACHVAGVAKLFRVGGAQAVAAMAYGTATVPRVDKICGPGNAYVAAAKRIVFGQVDIDMIAGPTPARRRATCSRRPSTTCGRCRCCSRRRPRWPRRSTPRWRASSPICRGARSRRARSRIAARSS